jgi:hypothetical protein
MTTAVASQARWVRALLDPEAPCPPGLRAWNGSDPARRFAVHRNNVVASLVDALAGTFPVVQELVGSEFFRAMAAAFVRMHPPQTPVLARYGADLAAFIAGFAPARPVPYLADVAALEWARVSACHAQDAEPLAVDALQHVLQSGVAPSALRFALHPSLRIVRSPFAIVSIWSAHQGRGALAALDPDTPETALVLRPHEDVLVLRCTASAATFVEKLQGGVPLAGSAAAAADGHGDFDLVQALGQLFTHGAVAALGWEEEAP